MDNKNEAHDVQSAHDEISQFEKRYQYDASYFHDLLDRSPNAFEVFWTGRRMTSFREHLPTEAYYVAAISVMQVEDCGACTQLNIRLALEEGVSADLLQVLLNSPDELSPTLRDVRHHALAVARGEAVDESGAERIEAAYGTAAFAELALCIAGVGIYPRLKRALLKEAECPIPTTEI